MTDTIEQLHMRMAAAAAALDFEEARRLRDRITLMRGGADATNAAAADTFGLVRQQPGAMGLGSGQPRVAPPPGWTPPPRPDPMTRGHGRRPPRAFVPAPSPIVTERASFDNALIISRETWTGKSATA